GYDAQLLRAVEHVNDGQKHVLFAKVVRWFGANPTGMTFAGLGLSFKPNNDDMREAPSRTLMASLWAAGARVQAYDPEAMHETRRLYPEQIAVETLRLCDNEDDALDGAEALIICTEWRAFRAPDYEVIKARLKQPVLFDGRNIHDPIRMKEEGIAYSGIGLGQNGEHQPVQYTG
ncbi:MAG: UDP binding domain-containing protein, partial [Thermomicrobiales bacterium]